MRRKPPHGTPNEPRHVPLRAGRQGRPTRGQIVEHQAKDGTWSFSIRWEVNGRRKQRLVARSKNKTAGRRMAELERAKLRAIWDADIQTDDNVDEKRTWKSASDKFIAWAEKHLEKSSAGRYRNVMDNFHEAGLHPSLLVDARGEVFERYKMHLLEQGRAPSGINYEIATLKRFWNWCRQAPRRWVVHDPFEGIDNLRSDKGADFAPRIFSAEECDSLRSVLAEPYRDVFNFAVDTGLRLGEIIWLDVGDVDLEECSVHVIAKKGHRIKTHERRSVPLTARAQAIVQKQIGDRTKGPLFRSPDSHKRWKWLGDKINPRIKKVAEDASFKTTRATFISYALRDTGGDLMTVMRWAGHSNVETTKQYLAAIPRSQKVAIDAVRFP